MIQYFPASNNNISESERNRRLATAYRIILSAAMKSKKQAHDISEKVTPNIDKDTGFENLEI